MDLDVVVVVVVAVVGLALGLVPTELELVAPPPPHDAREIQAVTHVEAAVARSLRPVPFEDSILPNAGVQLRQPQIHWEGPRVGPEVQWEVAVQHHWTKVEEEKPEKQAVVVVLQEEKRYTCVWQFACRSLRS